MSARAVLAALALGGATGIRSMAGVAALARRLGREAAPEGAGLAARALGNRPVGALVRAAAAGEVLADKVAPLPPRDAPAPLLGRVALGALSGVVAADVAGAPRTGPAVVGAVAAGLMAVAATRLRRRLGEGGAPDPAVALGEDAAAAALGAGATRLL